MTHGRALPDTDVDETRTAGREFWRGVLIAGGSTAIPRWTLDPVPGIARHEATDPRRPRGGVAPAGGRARRAARFGAAGRARQGARRAVRRGRRRDRLYRRAGRPAVALPPVDRPGSWRTSCLTRTGPSGNCWPTRTSRSASSGASWAWPGRRSRPCSIRSATSGTAAPSDTVLRVGIWPHARPARAAAAVPDRRARRGRRRQDRRLPPHRAHADRRRPGRRARAAEPAVGRRAPLPARRARRAAPGAAGPAGARAVRAAGAGASGRRRGRARRPAVDLPGAQRPREPAGPGPAGAGAAPRGRRRGGDRAQPGLDGRGPRRSSRPAARTCPSSRTSRPTASRPRCRGPSASSC